MTIAAILGIALIHLAAAISPGPSFVVSVRTSVSEGMRTATGLAIGFGLGACIWAMAAILGLAVLFEVAPTLFTAFKIIGGAGLLYIAWRTWRHAREPLPASTDGTLVVPRTLTSAVRLGLATQMANPKPAMFFGAVFAGLVPPDASWAIIALLMAIIFVQETLWYVCVARVFSLPKSRATYGRFKALIDRTFGGLIAALGLKIALT